MVQKEKKNDLLGFFRLYMRYGKVYGWVMKFMFKFVFIFRDYFMLMVKRR